MKNRMMFGLLGGAGACLIATPRVAADLVGLSVELEETVVVQGQERSVLRVYADFTSPNDRVNVWRGGGTLGAGVIQDVSVRGAATGFFNPGGAGSQIAPYSPNGVLEWGTFMTIGVPLGSMAPGGFDATTPLPGTPTFINGTTWTAPGSGGGVFVMPTDVQGTAGYIDRGSDTDHRVLLMQLTVNAGEFVQGTIGVSWSVDGVQGSGGVVTGLPLGFRLEHGHCCTPSGECLVTTEQGCLQFGNNIWLSCDPCAECEPHCLGDIVPTDVGDGVVDVNDLMLVIKEWGSGCCSLADIAAPYFMVEVNDLLAVLHDWGVCP